MTDHIVGDLTYVPVFDCFAKVVYKGRLLDGTTGYLVTNEHEGINDVLLRPCEMYGVISFR
jgi:hypothetical protein